MTYTCLTNVHPFTDIRTNRQADRQTGRQADRQTGRQADRQTGRQTDRQTDIQTGRLTETDKHTHKVTLIGHFNVISTF